MNQFTSVEEALKRMEAPHSIARLPFHVNAQGFVVDAAGSRVLVCSEDTDCALRFNELAVDSDGHFMCPNCGRLGQRMVDARPEQCGFAPNIQSQQPADKNATPKP